MLSNESNISIPCAVVLTAIPEEYISVRYHISELEEVIHPKGKIYEKGIFKGLYHN